jgi:hypothetical protein
MVLLANQQSVLSSTLAACLRIVTIDIGGFLRMLRSEYHRHRQKSTATAAVTSLHRAHMSDVTLFVATKLLMYQRLRGLINSAHAASLHVRGHDRQLMA